MKYVVDASVAIKWFLEEEGRDLAIHFHAHATEITAPDFIIIELLNILWKKVAKTELTKETALRISEKLHTAFDELSQTELLTIQAFSLSLQFNHAIFDCLYLAMAIETNSCLISADEKFVRKAKELGYSSSVILLADWKTPRIIN